MNGAKYEKYEKGEKGEKGVRVLALVLVMVTGSSVRANES